MDLRDFLSLDVFSYPGFRGETDIRDYLERRFKEYVRQLEALSGSDADLTYIGNAARTVARASEETLACLDSYLSGDMVAAVDHVGTAINCLGDHFVNLIGESEPAVWANPQGLFRARLGTFVEFSRSDLFHIPIEKRQLVAAQRYSIPGMPCLYLGSSVMICWEELGRPEFSRLHLSRFEFMSDRKAKILTVGPGPSYVRRGLEAARQEVHSRFLRNAARALAVSWPTILACSLRVRHPDAPFKPEYVVPQLLLQWTSRTDDPVVGVQYPSLCVDCDRVPLPYAINYAFPARLTRERDGVCSFLSGLFKMTEPVSWILARSCGVPASVNLLRPQEVEIVRGYRSNYDTTDFGIVEAMLKSMNADLVQGH